MAIRAQVTPTLFDKLVGDSELSGLQSGELNVPSEMDLGSLRFYAVPRLDSFKEKSLELTVRRELAWLLNTTNLEAVVDLEPYPEIRTSVLNYGVPDLAGKSQSPTAMRQRAQDMEASLRAFEPRLDPDTLSIQARSVSERENALTYLIRGNITAAATAIPMQLVSDIETDTGAVTLRD